MKLFMFIALLQLYYSITDLGKFLSYMMLQMQTTNLYKFQRGRSAVNITILNDSQ
jgi:hypothetical protein